MDNEPKILTLLGFAIKAGKLIAGKQAVLKAIQKNRAYLILLSNDVSFKTIEELQRLNTKWFKLSDTSKFELGKIVGRNELSIVAIGDQQFAKSIRKLFV